MSRMITSIAVFIALFGLGTFGQAIYTAINTIRGRSDSRIYYGIPKVAIRLALSAISVGLAIFIFAFSLFPVEVHLGDGVIANFGSDPSIEKDEKGTNYKLQTVKVEYGIFVGSKDTESSFDSFVERISTGLEPKWDSVDCVIDRNHYKLYRLHGSNDLPLAYVGLSILNGYPIISVTASQENSLFQRLVFRHFNNRIRAIGIDA